MNRFYILVFSLILILSIQSSNAIELQETPIQTSMSISIYAAADNWNLEDNASTTTTKKNTVTAQKEKKSAFKAAFYSALLPGLGQHYVGSRTKAKVFFAAEAATWMGYFAFNAVGNWRKDDYIDYAKIHAGASLEGKSDEFVDWVGFYDSSDEFNSLGRVSDPDRAYLSNPEDLWQWSTDAAKEEFRTYKNRSRDAFRHRDFMIVAAIGTRIIAIIDAIRTAKKHNNTEKIEISDIDSYNYKFSFNPLSKDNQISLTVMTPF